MPGEIVCEPTVPWIALAVRPLLRSVCRLRNEFQKLKQKRNPDVMGMQDEEQIPDDLDSRQLILSGSPHLVERFLPSSVESLQPNAGDWISWTCEEFGFLSGGVFLLQRKSSRGSLLRCKWRCSGSFLSRGILRGCALADSPDLAHAYVLLLRFERRRVE